MTRGTRCLRPASGASPSRSTTRRMSAVSTRPEAVASYIPALERRLKGSALGWRLGLAAVLALALGLRLWGIKQGLPYAYNADENAHFLPRAIGMFGHDLDPGYYVNPSAYTYVLHILLAVRYGGRLAVGEAFASDPTAVWTMARAASAVLGTIAAGLLYLAGRRLAGRGAGLLAAAMLAVAFLPVFYSHLALNDVPTLAPLCLALWGAAGVLRTGRGLDYAIAGIGLGLAAATKYTGGIVLLALLAAFGAHALRNRGAALRGLLLAGVLALAAFLVAFPYAIIDHHAFLDGLSHQSDASREAAGKLGITQDNGWLYYLWSFGWGLGWAPLVAAGLALPVLAFMRRWALLAFLAPAPVLFVAFMGSQERFFGRWLMPVLPFVCLLAAICAVLLVSAATRRAPALRPTLAALVAIGLCGQGIVVNIEDFEKTLRPELVSLFEREGYCWVIVGSTQRGRAEAEPEQVPGAIAYYRELERRGDVVYHASPYSEGRGPVTFNFDWSFNFYPLAYARPGPDMTVY